MSDPQKIADRVRPYLLSSGIKTIYISTDTCELLTKLRTEELQGFNGNKYDCIIHIIIIIIIIILTIYYYYYYTYYYYYYYYYYNYYYTYYTYYYTYFIIIILIRIIIIIIVKTLLSI
jgi:hypothetical protein